MRRDLPFITDPRIKEWAYAGFTFTFISAFIAHTVSGDPVANRIAPAVALLLLAVSYLMYHKMMVVNQSIQPTADIK